MSRQFPRTAAVLAVLTAGALNGWNAPLSAARQAPDSWSAEHRAVLPSGLSVQFDLTAETGTAVTAEAGRLADRSGGGRSVGYADGMHAGDPAQTFLLTPDRPQTDGSWRTVGTLRLGFSRPVRNPRLHLSGLAAVATGNSGTTSTAARLTLTGGSPAAPGLIGRTDWPGWTVDGNALAPAGTDGSTDAAAGSAAEGTLELTGPVRTAVFRIEQRSTPRAGSTTAPPVLRQAYTVTVDEDLGTAPQAYGNASHVLSDLFLGADATGPGHRDRRRPAVTADRPLVELDHDAVRRGNPFASLPAGPSGSPPPPKLQPGRGEYQGADPSLGFPDEAAIGRYYRVTVPVAVGDQPATLAGWIDFDHSGRFDPADRVQTEIPAGADTATLEWTVPAGAASGDTWARLRIGRDTSQLVPSGGFADSGEVSDQRIRLTVGAARPEVAEPVDGTVLADARPRISGEGAVAGASMEIRDGDTVLCRAKVERKGDWSCRPGSALAAGPHSLTPVETTTGGVVLRGEPAKVTVKTTPPTAPVLTLPAYTNDPGLQLTGTGEAGSTVSVTDRSASASTPASASAELCSSAVRPDGGWSCLPVENLADGSHQLAPVAVDAAGNRTAGQPVALVVDTVPPDKPVLTAPAPGEVLRVSRPKLAGRAEAGANVQVAAAPTAGGDRTVLCGATAALDGSWSCTAGRDLTDGEQWLTVTVTDRAGNGTSADPVRVRVAAAGVASPSAASSPAVSPPAVSAPVVSSPAVSPSAAGPSVVGPSAVSPSVVGPSGAVPSGAGGVASVAASASVSASPSASASAAPSAVVAPTAVGSPSPTEVPVFPPIPVGLLPIVVPPVAPSVLVAPAVPPVPAPSVTSVPAVPAGVSAAPTSPGASTGSGASARPPVPFVPAGSAVPAPPSGSAVPSPGVGSSRALAASPGGSPAPVAASPSEVAAVPLSAADQEGSRASGTAARPLPAPPAEGAAAARPREAGRHGLLAGVLLVLAGIGLITRRVFARGSGARRR
ncbi:Ig-like domain-containing protein [Kitasatospora sp. NPDC059088]|uniref:Ig-like domain-containing protein n=1 Tax=Kitasatospora sp. NPDC059088 TaxID=3346722 RepID=UPI00367B929A